MRRLAILAIAILALLLGTRISAHTEPAEPEEAPTEEVEELQEEQGELITDEERARAKERHDRWVGKITEIEKEHLNSYNDKTFKEGQAKILAIDDPECILPLVEVLFLQKDSAATQSLRKRSLLIKALAQFSEKDNALAQVCLQEIAVCDGNRILRRTAIAALKKIKESDNRSDRLLEHLQSDAVPIARDRAAYALAELGEKRAIAYLIDALVTEETQEVEEQMDNLTLSFTYGTGKKGRWIVPRTVHFPVKVKGKLYHIPYKLLMNPATTIAIGTRRRVETEEKTVLVEHPRILSALKQLTKMDFGYDQLAWRRWLKENPDEVPPWRPLKIRN